MKLLKSLNYGTPESNFVNYYILGLSGYYAYEKRQDLRIYLVLFSSILIQLGLCEYLLPCRGISIIYCFLFGFLIKTYMDEKNTKKAVSLSIALSLLLIVSGFTFEVIRANPLLLIGFLLEHAIFTAVGVLFALIKLQEVVPAPKAAEHLQDQ
jgi:hypothetical protein